MNVRGYRHGDSGWQELFDLTQVACFNDFNWLKIHAEAWLCFGTCQWLDKVNNIFLKNSRWKSNENAMHTLHFSLCLFLTFCKVRNQNTPELLTDDVEINMLQMFHSTMYGIWLVILLFNCKALGIVMAVLFRVKLTWSV